MLSHNYLYISFALVFPVLSVGSTLTTYIGDTSPATKNANHIFNAIHSSMRQWGSSLNHNGMSFFPAHMPAGTELYHGTGTPDPVEVMEWLAFEPEHALNFAFEIIWEPPANNSVDQDSRSSKWALDSSQTRLLIEHTFSARHDGLPQRHDSQQRLLRPSGRPSPPDKRPPHGVPVGDPVRVRPGWLHTYVMKRDLRLVYIDGQSAAKSPKGTLDSQDYILGPGSLLDNDRKRGLRLCKIAAKDWGGRIDGFVRMEHGFELILCDFKANAQLLRVEKANGFEVEDEREDNMRTFSFMKAITARYHGIGMNRVTLDYSRVVTAYAYDIDLFPNHSSLPRLANTSRSARAAIFAELSQKITHNPTYPPHHWTNWQAIADMLVARYSDALHSLAHSPFYASNPRLDLEITLLMRPFIDYSRRNASLETQRCAAHFMPATYHPDVASAAVISVSTRICETLAAAAGMQSAGEARRALQALGEYLQWTAWKDCRGCGYEEVCLTAIWPLGDEEDHVSPACRNGTGMAGRWGYWRDES
ncbi:hypothetical protein MMC13_005103 [Lambiella insularis]|nr:hypothetical protein [Lambiella insularis]